jgi:hypothetical protein
VSSPGITGIYSEVKIVFTILFSVTALSLMSADSTKQPFERYRTIIERKPFGPEPVNFDPEAAPGSAGDASRQEGGEMTAEQRTAEEQQLASNVRVSMINVAPSGVVKVGFTDSGVTPPENYYLAVGGTQNGWSVKSADPGSESVTLAKGAVEVTVKLGESSGGKGASKRAPAGRSMASRSHRPMTLESKGDRPAFGGALGRLRRKRQEERQREREEDEKKAAAAEAERIAREEREAAEAEEKRRAAEEREQQREALLQIQEQLRMQRKEREAASQEDGETATGNEE